MHDEPNPSKTNSLDKFLGQRDDPKAYSTDAARRDYRKLRQHNDIVTVLDTAVARLKEHRLGANADLPLRITATISEENPYFLYYEMRSEDKWDPSRDVLCVSNGIDIVLDQLTVVRIHGTTLTWETQGSEQGFRFKNPNWPRRDLGREPWQDDVTEEVAMAVLKSSKPAETRPRIIEVPKQHDKRGSSVKGVGGTIVGAILLGMLLKVPGLLMKNAGQQPQQFQPNRQALQFETDRLQEQIRQGEDVSDALLILSGIDPEEYKPFQQRTQESKLMQESSDFAKQGLYREAVDSLDNILEESPDSAAFHNSKAWILATCPDDEVRNGDKAIEHATKACEYTEWTNGSYLDTLAASHAEAGDFASAIDRMQQAVELSTDDAQKQRFLARVELYQSRQPYRDGVAPKTVTSPQSPSE